MEQDEQVAALTAAIAAVDSGRRVGWAKFLGSSSIGSGKRSTPSDNPC